MCDDFTSRRVNSTNPETTVNPLDLSGPRGNVVVEGENLPSNNDDNVLVVGNNPCES